MIVGEGESEDGVEGAEGTEGGTGTERDLNGFLNHFLRPLLPPVGMDATESDGETAERVPSENSQTSTSFAPSSLASPERTTGTGSVARRDCEVELIFFSWSVLEEVGA